MAIDTDERATVSVEEAARILGVGRGSAYEGIRTGRIPSIRVSARRIVVPRIALERMLNGETFAAIERGAA